MDQLALLANISQLISLSMNMAEVSNDKLMEKLLQQDKMLDEQTNIYLDQIVKQNAKILEKLENLQKQIIN